MTEHARDKHRQGHQAVVAWKINEGSWDGVDLAGLTVAAGFAALLASSFLAIRDFGAVTVIDVLLALLATIVVVPPLALYLVRRREAA